MRKHDINRRADFVGDASLKFNPERSTATPELRVFWLRRETADTNQSHIGKHLAPPYDSLL